MEPDRGRYQRSRAAIVGFAIFVVAIWLVATGGPFGRGPSPTPTEPPTPTTEAPVPIGPPVPPGPTGPQVSTRVGFVGLPPDGAPPSRPKTGELVLGYFGRQFTHWYEVWVYADGRLVWQREGDVSEGANEYATGYLEQRLTPEGIELLRARGSAEAALFGFPWRPPYPASWLPPRAWADREIRAYVPSRYAVCYQGLLRPIEPSRILSWLPASAAELMRSRASDVEPDERRFRRSRGRCSDLPTEEARAVAEALEEAGLRQDPFQSPYALTYYLRAPGPAWKEAVVRFEPILPHGEVGCSSCG